MLRIRRWFGSVRARVSIAAVVIVGIALILFGVATLRITASGMLREVQNAATAQASSIALITEAGRLDPLITGLAGNTFVQVVNEDGEIVAASWQLTDYPPLGDYLIAPGQSDTTTLRLLSDSGSTDYRMVALGSDTPGNRARASTRGIHAPGSGSHYPRRNGAPRTGATVRR